MKDEKPLYQVFRRPRTGGPWQMWGDACISQSAAFNSISTAELQATEELWDYSVQREGDRPPESYGGQTYENRMMRTRQ